MNEEDRAPVEQGETFLEMLYHHEEQQRIPEVNEDFLRRLSGLSEENQYKAMEHISRLSGLVAASLQSEVYQARLIGLYKVWFEDQTEEWVNLYFRPPVERQYWERETERRKAQHDGEERALSLGEAKKELGL